MKQFLIEIAIFLLLTLSLATITDIFVSKGLQHCPKNHLETMNIVMHEKPANDVLILGNSRGANGYDTYILDSILGCNSRNLSVSGQTFRISNLRYQAYRRNNPAPKLIIMNIDHYELGEGNLGYENYMYYPYITDTLVKPILELNHFNWLDRNCPMYRYRGDYKFICLGLSEFFNIYHLNGKGYKGYTPNPANSWNGKYLRDMIKNNPKGITVDCDTAILIIADNFLAQAKSEGVHIIMVYSPLYYEVQNHLSPQFKHIVETYNALSQKYDVPILNYQHTYINQDSIYFKDGNHLNQLGAALFTTQLANDLNSLQLYKKDNKSHQTHILK